MGLIRVKAKVIVALCLFVGLNICFLGAWTWNIKILHRREAMPALSLNYLNQSLDTKAKLTDVALTKGHTITLTVRMTATPKLVKHLYCALLRSAALFWSPKLGHIGLILDEESKIDRKFAARLRQQEQSLGFKFDLIYEPLPKDPTILKGRPHSPGYMRQLWSSFVMDLYINTSVIAWIDTDGMFTTPVTPENIFNGDKLRVSRFEDAFKKMIPKRGIPSPVNIIMNYAYYFEHDRYDWHLDVNNDLKDYNKRYAQPGFEIKLSDTFPDVHVTVHEKYYTTLPNPMLQGYCIAKRYVGTPPAGCRMFENTTNFNLFEFCSTNEFTQGHLYSWCSPRRWLGHCTKRIESHYLNVQKYYQLGLFDLNLQRVSAVEQVAARENCSCPHIFQFG